MDFSHSIEAEKNRSHGNFWLALGLIVLALTGFMGYQSWLQMNTMKDAAKDVARIEVGLAPTLEAVNTAYKNEKTFADQKTDEADLALASIFPATSEETTLTRLFDNYMSKHDYANSPLFLESLSFGSSEFDEKNGVSYLPVQLSLTGSRDNFFGFLSYIENSGSFDDGVRLMDVAEVNVDVSDAEDTTESTDAPQMVNFSVSIRAYFQPSLGTGND